MTSLWHKIRKKHSPSTSRFLFSGFLSSSTSLVCWPGFVLFSPPSWQRILGPIGIYIEVCEKIQSINATSKCIRRLWGSEQLGGGLRIHRTSYRQTRTLMQIAGEGNTIQKKTVANNWWHWRKTSIQESFVWFCAGTSSAKPYKTRKRCFGVEV